MHALKCAQIMHLTYPHMIMHMLCIYNARVCECLFDTQGIHTFSIHQICTFYTRINGYPNNALYIHAVGNAHYMHFTCTCTCTQPDTANSTQQRVLLICHAGNKNCNYGVVLSKSLLASDWSSRILTISHHRDCFHNAKTH